MKVNLILLTLLLNISFAVERAVDINSPHSSSLLDGKFYAYRPTNMDILTRVVGCEFNSTLFNFTCTQALNFDSTSDFAYIFKFVKLTGSISNTNMNFVFGSIRYDYLSKLQKAPTPKFSTVGDKDKPYAKSPLGIKEAPNFDNFPDIEYSISLTGDPTRSADNLDANLYIFGGLKRSDKASLKLTKGFFSYDFKENKWGDLTDRLPKEYDLIAGNELVNINNEKLVSLGGYKSYQISLSSTEINAYNVEFLGFKNLLIFDIKSKKWEYKTTSMGLEDESLLALKKQYSSTGVHFNNKLYVYGGFSNDATNKQTHHFGILDLESWTWRWKHFAFDVLTGPTPLTEIFDSMIINNTMLISYSFKYSYGVRFFGFDLNTENYTTEVPNTQGLFWKESSASASKPESDFAPAPTPEQPNNPSESVQSKSTPDYPIIFGSIIGAIAALIVLYLGYRYYERSQNPLRYKPKYETKLIWSDIAFGSSNNPNYYKVENDESILHLRNIKQFETMNLMTQATETKPNNLNPVKELKSLVNNAKTLIANSLNNDQYTRINKKEMVDSMHKWDPYSTA
jgi:hypothetical protein